MHLVNNPAPIPSNYIAGIVSDSVSDSVDQQATAKACNISVDVLNIWLKHLASVHDNRIKGAKKAMKTRMEKKASKSK